MRILFVSTSYPQSSDEWQGTFIRNLLGALANHPDLNIRFWGPSGNLPDGVTDVTGDDQPWLESLQARGGIAQSLRKGGWRAAADATTLLWRLRRVYIRHRDVDIYHINWLHNALPLLGIPGAAVISCLGSDHALLDRPTPTTLLNRVLNKRQAAITPNAAWMRDRLIERLPAVTTVQTIPFGVDIAWYNIERAAPETPIWLSVNRLTREKIGPLFDWGQIVKNCGGELHLFGPIQEELEIPDWVHYHGPATPNELRTIWFPRATGLISLSVHSEGLPQVMIEASASGLPIIASRIPGHEAALNQGRHGCLVSTREEFESSIHAISQPTTNLKTGIAARKWAYANVGTWKDCAYRYTILYNEILQAGVAR